MRIGYARVSTLEQTLDDQEARLRAAGCDEVHSEKISGLAVDRPVLSAIDFRLKRDDELMVTKLDRLSRSVQAVSTMYAAWEERGVKLVSLDEPYINHQATGKLMLNLMATFAEFERDRLAERTREGVARARANGVQIGKPFKLTQEEVANMRTLRDGGASISALSRQFGIARSTVYAYLQLSPEDRKSKLKPR